MHWPVWTTIALALLFNFLVGVHGAGNAVSTVISSRAFGPRTALTLGALAEFLGPFLFGTAVARTVGAQIIQPGEVTLDILIAALLAAICWHAFTWYLGLPSSSSHGLVGGMAGATLVGAGIGALQVGGLVKVLLGLFLSPLFGFVLGFGLLRLIFNLTAGATPRINDSFKRWQFFTVFGLGLTHGANDAQKAMGIIGLTLVLGTGVETFQVPFWVILGCAGTMALGTLLGGFRIIRTMGGKFYKVRPVDSFAVQFASTIVMFLASVFGWPVSTAQVVSSSIIGVGAAERVSKVRWGVAGEIIMAWIMTVPITMGISALIYWGMQQIPG